MASILTLDDLQKHFEQAREKLSRNRQAILTSNPLPPDFDSDKYGFCYFRAERIGLEAVRHALGDIAWLPMQLDPQSEMIMENRDAMKRWMGAAMRGQPDSADFGNDFIHALTRAAMRHGWNNASFRAAVLGVSELFHDLSCLIGLIYYGVWMSENGIAGLPISDPYDLERTAQEIEKLTRAPEIARLLRHRREAEAEKKRAAMPRKKAKPFLRVIENAGFENTTHL